MDQRQRIFEEVIIQRMKVIQEFTKSRYGKLNRQVRDVKAGQLQTAAAAAAAAVNQSWLNDATKDIDAIDLAN